MGVYYATMRNPVLLLLVTCLILNAQNPGRGARPNTPTPVSQLIQTLREETNPDQAMRDVRTIWETDRWFTFPKFEETARNVAAILRRRLRGRRDR